jgi:hypothetical protein
MLRDYWREIEDQEGKATARIKRIDVLLDKWDRHVQREGVSDEIASVRDDLLEQRRTCAENVRAARARRPFPAA